MDYEKKYKESMAKMSAFLAKHDGFTISKDGEMYKELSEIFPELKESEDESTRKWIIRYLENRVLNTSIFEEKESCKTAIKWLEKQGKNNMGISEATKQELEDNLTKSLEKETAESCNEFLDEQKPVEPKFNIGDKVKKGYLTYTVENIDKDSYKLQAYSKDGDKGCTVFLSIGHEENYELVEQKPVEWSEEDENTVASIISSLSNPQLYPHTIHDIDWLKSLRPQKKEALPQWRRLPINGISYAPDSWRVMDVITSTVGANSASVPALVKGDYYVPLFELEKFIRNI